MENEYRLFMWFTLAYYKMVNREPNSFVTLFSSFRVFKIGNW